MVHRSLETARSASIRWLVPSLLAMAVTYLLAAEIYGRLALHRLRFWQTVLVEVAASFINRLLPAGLGGLGLHGVYLFRRKHTAAEATVVVSVNNLLGIVAHMLLLACVVLARPGVIGQLHFGDTYEVSWRLIAGCAVLVLGLLLIPYLRQLLQRFIQNLVVSIRRVRPQAAAQALLLAMFLTATYTLILLCCARSLGVSLGALQVFVVFSLGMLAGTATPTPGGLVGVEAGLFAGFVAYGLPATTAGAVVLLYRLVTYWLPLFPGLVALPIARKRSLV